ncbi:MAG: phosphoenolpyruvate--protein phosphotransferase, partial [Gammaproteobacteria bacterium]|nr:phosphoenolpyruvate--protein phosphotransferase [Gammaproteobacteria bacterium]
MTGQTHSRTYQGVAVAPGVAVGKARLVDTSHFPTEVPRYGIGEKDIERELKRLRIACAETKEELNALADKVGERLGAREADLIRPQALMVEDPVFIAEVEELIVEQRLNAEAAVGQVMEQFEKLIESLDDRYLAERSMDVRDAGRRILANLLFIEHEITPHLAEPCVVVATHLLPSLTVRLESDKILAFASEKGGHTSHAAILARSLGIPAVTALQGLTGQLLGGETLLVDGNAGTVIVGPSEARLVRYKKL